MSMFARLFLLIGLVSTISLGLVAGLLWRNSVELERQLHQENETAGQNVQREGTTLLEDSLSNTHLMIVNEKASKVDAYFSNIANTVQLEATLVRQCLADTGTLAKVPPLFEGNTLTGMARADPNFDKNFVAAQPYTMYHLAPGVTLRQSTQAMNRLRRMGGFFANIQHNFQGCDSIYYGSRLGFILGYPGGSSYFKNAYDPRQRLWYRKATAPGLVPGTMIWQVDVDRDTQTIFLTCGRSVTVKGESQPAGVVAMDVRVSDIVGQMFRVGNLKVSKAMLVDADGKVRVSASYQLVNGKVVPQFDSQDSQKMPPVSSVAGFSDVAAHINQTPTKTSDIYWAGKEKDASMTDAGSVFIYSTVNFATGHDDTRPGTRRAGGWHYILQLPMRSLLHPIRSMTSEMQHSTEAISIAIQAKTQKSAAIVLALIGVTLLAALLVAYLAARAVSRPLTQMAAVARGVGEGKLDQRAIETSGGEIGEMGRAINAMISGLRQRNLLKETFGRYTAPSVVEEVLKRGGVQLGGVKSVATIFFSDLAGFTTLSEKTPPETLVALLNEYFDAMTKVILESEGTLDKYIGDAILAFWGHPIAHEDDAARSCRVALKQFEELRRLCKKWEAEGRPPLDMRIGIETGEVIVGDIGSELKLNYTVLGDTVNFASRLEAVNKVYGTHILIGEITRQAAGAAVEVREIDLLAVVGKHIPVRVYELLGMAGEISARQKEGYGYYEAGLQAYRQREWDEAEASLGRAKEVLGVDKACDVLMKRIAQCRLQPPPADWDGGAILDHK